MSGPEDLDQIADSFVPSWAQGNDSAPSEAPGSGPIDKHAVTTEPPPAPRSSFPPPAVVQAIPSESVIVAPDPGPTPPQREFPKGQTLLGVAPVPLVINAPDAPIVPPKAPPSKPPPPRAARVASDEPTPFMSPLRPRPSLESISPDDEIVLPKKQGSALYIAIGAVLALGAGGAYFALRGGDKGDTTTVAPRATATETRSDIPPPPAATTATTATSATTAKKEAPEATKGEAAKTEPTKAAETAVAAATTKPKSQDVSPPPQHTAPPHAAFVPTKPTSATKPATKGGSKNSGVIVKEVPF